jgi:hypothetical protein
MNTTNSLNSNNGLYVTPKLFDLNMLTRIQEEEQVKREILLRQKKQEFL